jgi:hypothetical protein
LVELSAGYTKPSQFVAPQCSKDKKLPHFVNSERPAGVTFQIEGVANLSQVGNDIDTITLTGGLQTITENWTGIDTLQIVNGANIQAGALHVSEVEINDAAPVPEPASLLMLGSGLLGLGGAIKRKLGK